MLIVLDAPCAPTSLQHLIPNLRRHIAFAKLSIIQLCHDTIVRVHGLVNSMFGIKARVFRLQLPKSCSMRNFAEPLAADFSWEQGTKHDVPSRLQVRADDRSSAEHRRFSPPSLALEGPGRRRAVRRSDGGGPG